MYCDEAELGAWRRLCCWEGIWGGVMGGTPLGGIECFILWWWLVPGEKDAVGWGPLLMWGWPP